MAHSIICDICGDFRGAQSATMSLNAEVVAIDMCFTHVNEAFDFLERYQKQGKPASLNLIPDLIRDAAIGKEAAYKAAAGVELKDVRSWAKANGVTVPDRGRISGAVIQQFKNAAGL